MEIEEIGHALEAMLFAAGDPVPLQRLGAVLELDGKTLQSLLDRLSDEYRFGKRGIRLVRMEDKVQLVSAPEYSTWVRRMLEERRPPQLTKASLETLAIVAYYQPTTRAFIEQVRGVDSAYAVSSLQDKELICECGRLDVPGRPIQYATTPVFLRSFGLSSLKDLPELPFDETDPGGQLSFLHVAGGQSPETQDSPEEQGGEEDL